MVEYTKFVNYTHFLNIEYAINMLITSLCIEDYFMYNYNEDFFCLAKSSSHLLDKSSAY